MSRTRTKRSKRRPTPASGPKPTPMLPLDGVRYWRRGRSGIHATGLFAARAIPRGARVIEYVGHLLTKAEGWRRATAWLEKVNGSDRGGVYVFELNARHDIDGNVPWNTARLINHSCEPNCEPRVTRGRIWIVARRAIEPGEELTYDYGYDFENWEEHPCRCGAARCIGHIVAAEHRPRLRRILARRRARAAAAR